MNWAVFLDRDGVLNRSLVRGGRPYAPLTIEEFEILPGVEEALASLKQAEARLIVVTNQPDVAMGTVRRSTIEAMHRMLCDRLPIDDIRICCHTDADDCTCRKPAPGMLLDAARAHAVALERSFMVGDRWRDVGAGRAAGCRTIFVDHSYTEVLTVNPDYAVASLSEAARLILYEHKMDNQRT